jgi:Rieske Fe-S protein
MSSSNPGGPSRRTLLSAAALAVPALGAAGAVAGCESYGQPTAPADGGADGGANDPPATGQPATGQPPATEGGGGPPPLAQVADIPVGGGTIFAAAKVVVTQPEAGTVKAFSVACTHQGCAVSDVSDGTINCNCHGSKFKVADGSVAKGPAKAPLEVVNVTVQDGAIRLA